MKNLRIETLLLLLLLPLMPMERILAAPDLGESLDYTLRFRGLVTGFVELDIANLTLSVGPAMEEVADQSAYFTHMQLTTEPYKKAELIYPVRLDYRSWLDQQNLQSLLVAKFLVTGKEKREFFWFDRSDEQCRHYQTPKSGTSLAAPTPPQPLLNVAALDDRDWTLLRENQRVALDQGEILDYMGMLHRLRRLPAESGKWFDYTVYTGKRLQHYRGRLERQRLVRRGWDRDTLHVQLYEYEPQKDKLKDEVQLWFSDDDQRLLLRFYTEGALGALEGILETGRPDNGRHDDLAESTRRSLEAYLDF
ncbi:MAG: DUF3108 domain-containing protein [Chromatiales bacterium]